MTQEKINRINELTAISRVRELTEQEQEERKALRQEYVKSMVSSLTGQLENTTILYPDGTKKKVEKKS